MRKVLTWGTILSLLVAVALFLGAGRPTEAGGEKGPMIAHNVYFSLKEDSPKAREKLIAACKKYLSKHEGEVFFAVGTLVEDLKRPVNDRDFDVSLHLVFRDRKAHDQYQEAERHKQFIEENKENWKKVRVFDSVVK
jgi:hypothetical protein